MALPSEFKISPSEIEKKAKSINSCVDEIIQNIVDSLNYIIAIFDEGSWSGDKATNYYNEMSSVLTNGSVSSISYTLQLSKKLIWFFDFLVNKTKEVETNVEKLVNDSKTSDVKTPTPSTKSQTPSTTNNDTQKIKIVFGENDSLWNLAIKYGYKGEDWPKLFVDSKGNPITKDSDARKIRTGEVIYLVGLNGAAAAGTASGGGGSTGSSGNNNTGSTTNKKTTGTIKKTVGIPSGKKYGTVMRYMSYQKVTSSTAEQGKFRIKLEKNNDMYYDSEGFAKVKDPEGDRYIIACTTTYGQPGDKVDFVMSDGTVIKGVIGDIKEQSDPGCNKYGHEDGKCIIEFCVNGNGTMRNGNSVSSSIPKWYKNGKGNHSNPGENGFHKEWSNISVVKVNNYGSYY